MNSRGVLEMLIIRTDKKKPTNSASEIDTCDAERRAEGGILHNTRQLQWMRIGQWPARMAPAPTTPTFALETNNAIHRSGTDLLNEEEDIGTIRSRNSMNSSTNSENDATRVHPSYSTSSAEDLATVEPPESNVDRDYYQFEWFWILIGMIVLMISIVVLVVLAYMGNIVVFAFSILLSLAIGLGSTTLYTGIFVVLMEYHEAIGKAVHRYARLQPELQRTCLRVFAYAYACGVVAVVAVLFVYSSDLYIVFT